MQKYDFENNIGFIVNRAAKAFVKALDTEPILFIAPAQTPVSNPGGDGGSRRLNEKTLPGKDGVRMLATLLPLQTTLPNLHIFR